MKYIKASLIITIICCVLAGCGSKDGDETPDTKAVVEATAQTETKTEAEATVSKETETAQEDETTAAAEENKYPIVPGFPIDHGNGVKECKLFVNGVVYEDCNGYTKDEHPDKLFFTQDPIMYKTSEHTCGIISSSKINGVDLKLSGKVINGHMVLSAVGKSFLAIDDDVYEDLAPELIEFLPGWEDYCVTTLVLEKICGAKVHISEDRSAAYIEMDAPISNEDNDKYSCDIVADGKFVATDKATGEEKSIYVPEKYRPAAKDTSGSNSGSSSGNNSSNPPQRTRCSQCGGSGFTNSQSMVWDPFTNSYRSQTVTGTCPSCHGTGYR